jgi:threonine synthase
VFYPEGKVSDIQRLQMVTQPGANVAVCAIRGTFDDAQTQVKRIFADRELASRLADGNCVLSSANSINVGRLVPQVTYYFDAYAQLVRNGAVKVGDAVDFCVPTGNFGDVLAGYYAKRLGLPVGRLVVASNTNKVLTDFIETGVYDRRREFAKTISPSMDILVSSNLERMLYYLTDGDCEHVARLMGELQEKGIYDIGSDLLGKLRETFGCGFATDDETRQTIRATWEREGVLIDPHTAVAKCVLDRTQPEGRQRVCLSTANPYKFSSDVLAALGKDVTGMDGFACMDALQALTKVAAPAQLSGLRDASVLHASVCDQAEMGAFVEGACERVFA